MISKEILKEIIKKGEGIETEFKECKENLSKNLFETVCAFLNRHGGNIFLGVSDDREIKGVEKPEKLFYEFITQANNPDKLSPTYNLIPEIVDFDGKKIIYISVPESSQVHRTNGKIFDRNSDGDFNITNNTDMVGAMYIRKQPSHSENVVYPYAELADLRPDLIEQTRIMMRNKSGDNHPLIRLSDFEMLKSLGLHIRDFKTGETGFTLAAILLFGKDETIMSVLPYYKTDAILRRENTDRYDDRDDIRTNLIDSYDRLMNFIRKHLPDPFYLEGDRRISLRHVIFREAAANILIHREFMNGFPAKMIIGRENVLFENASRPHGYGHIQPENFMPYPKNPRIARVFREIGYAEELGSGVRNLFRYLRIYSNAEPEIIEGDIFKVILPLMKSSSGYSGYEPGRPDIINEYNHNKYSGYRVNPQEDYRIPPGYGNDTGGAASNQNRDAGSVKTSADDDIPFRTREELLIEYCRIPRSAKEMMEYLNLKHRDHFREEILRPLLQENKLFMTDPGSPRSPRQKYTSVKLRGRY
ncbi:MAG: putative DNA binding domain-containing protein [Ignavibacteriaceae bacterium]|nr:putative DNA binding domain-containing protein [Ignavibacteriaceae bacterium]